jgi:hypothetical protein
MNSELKKNPIMERLRGKLSPEDKKFIEDYFDSLDRTPSPSVRIKTAKQILRQHLHGYSDEQFEEQINKFPLNECLFAMERYHAQFSVDGWISVEDRLPEESGLVFICLKDSQDIYISFYKKDQKLFQVWGAGRDPIIDMKTTHWMNMPKPPMYKCREMDCEKDATKEDYPGNAFYLCDEHYEKYHPSPPQKTNES